MSPIRRAAGRTFSSLQSKNLRLYFAGLAVSQMGSWIQMVALPWLVLELTHSGTALGLTYAIQFLPMLLLGAWAGVITDRYDKYKMTVLTTVLLGAVATTLGVITLLGVVQLWSVIVIAVLVGTLAAFDTPIRRSFVSELVQPDELTNAVSLTNAVFTLARIIGPTIAGVLIATVGVGWCFVLNGASYLAVLVALQFMDRKRMHATEPIPRSKGQLMDGIRYAWRERLVRLSIIMSFVVGLFAFNYNILIPLLAKRTFHTGPAGYAVMFAATGVGALIGALISAHHSAASARVMVKSAILLGVVLLAVAVAPTLPIVYLALVLFGVTSMVFLSMAGAAVQERPDPAYRGRATALFVVAFSGSTPIGSPIVGAIAQNFGPRAALALGGIGAIVAGTVGLMVFRRWVSEAHQQDAVPSLDAVRKSEERTSATGNLSAA